MYYLHKEYSSHNTVPMLLSKWEDFVLNFV